MPGATSFRVGFLADFINKGGQLISPDIGPSLLESEPNLSYEFLQNIIPSICPTSLLIMTFSSP